MQANERLFYHKILDKLERREHNRTNGINAGLGPFALLLSCPEIKREYCCNSGEELQHRQQTTTGDRASTTAEDPKKHNTQFITEHT